MRSEERIKERIEIEKKYLEFADNRYDWTQKEVIEKIIETLEWTLGKEIV